MNLRGLDHTTIVRLYLIVSHSQWTIRHTSARINLFFRDGQSKVVCSKVMPRQEQHDREAIIPNNKRISSKFLYKFNDDDDDYDDHDDDDDNDNYDYDE